MSEKKLIEEDLKNEISIIGSIFGHHEITGSFMAGSDYVMIDLDNCRIKNVDFNFYKDKRIGSDFFGGEIFREPIYKLNNCIYSSAVEAAHVIKGKYSCEYCIMDTEK